MVAGQITPESRSAMEGADRLLHLVSDASTRMWLERLNPNDESLYDAYGEERPGPSRTRRWCSACSRRSVRERVCVALYGHPGVYVYPSHEAIRRARAEGHPARMLPGVSAEDCLYADLELDPARPRLPELRGHRLPDPPAPRRPDHRPAPLAGGRDRRDHLLPPRRLARRGRPLLAETLLDHYPADHEVVLYTASTLPIAGPTIRRMPLSALPDAGVSVASTLYVPPSGPAPVDRRRRPGAARPPDPPGDAGC